MERYKVYLLFLILLVSLVLSFFTENHTVHIIAGITSMVSLMFIIEK